MSAGSWALSARAIRRAVFFWIRAISFWWSVRRVSIVVWAVFTSSAIFAGSPDPPIAFKASAAAFRAFSALFLPLLAPLYFSAGTKVPSFPTTRSTSFPSLPLPFKAASTWFDRSSPRMVLTLSVIMVCSFPRCLYRDFHTLCGPAGSPGGGGCFGYEKTPWKGVQSSFEVVCS